jgi:hypothetical protein
MSQLATGDLLFQLGVSPAEDGVPEPQHSVTVHGAIQVERDVAITLKDGTDIYVDLFRPVEQADVPVLIAWGPYGKHNGGAVYSQFKDESGRTGAGVEPEWISEYTTFEGPDPKRWCANGYAVMNVDPRGTWWSGGEFATVWDEREARDVADVIAWSAAQPWTNGKVGMTGVSYLAVAQWWAASLRPAGLAAINPCEGLSDVYREFAFHGGIASHFPTFWQHNRLKYSRSKIEAMADMMLGHPLEDAYWASKEPNLTQIEVPAYVIGSWSDQGLHTRGTLNAFEQISSEHKFLEVHGRKKWEYYHRPETVERTRAFFDHFLRDVDNGVDEWPPVRLEMRRRFYDGAVRVPARWPAPERSIRRLHLDATEGVLTEAGPAGPAEARYTVGDDGGEVSLDYHFDEPVDVLGGMRLRLWVSAEGSDDMDLYIAVKKLDPDGEIIAFPFANVLEHGPLALGWLRVSHRAIDPERSTDERPWHRHVTLEPLSEGEPVAVEIEIWPSGTRFAAGEGLRLAVRGSDHYTGAFMSRHVESHNAGTHVLHAGGQFDSQLVFPVLAVEDGAPDWGDA